MAFILDIDCMVCSPVGTLREHHPRRDGPPLPQSDCPPAMGSFRPSPAPAARFEALAVADLAAPSAAVAALSGRGIGGGGSVA